MIKIERIENLRGVFEVLSQMMDYPQEATFQSADRRTLATNTALTGGEQKRLVAIFDALNQGSLLERQSHFTNLFDLNKRYTLYMSYYKMTDSRERGTVLAKLKTLYEMFGLAESTSELADYLPMMLEFFAYGDFNGDARISDLQLALGVLEDGTYTLLQRAQVDAKDPYLELVAAIRDLIRSCLEIEVKANA